MLRFAFGNELEFAKSASMLAMLCSSRSKLRIADTEGSMAENFGSRS